jgi:hypothetical protein
MEAIAHKSSIYGKVILANEIDNMTSNFKRILIVSFKQHFLRRLGLRLGMRVMKDD